jgi:hypothetical protein
LVPDGATVSLYVFAGATGEKLDSMGLVLLIPRSTYTTHGFRSSFRDWVGEATEHDSQTAEFALAHGLPNRTEAAYARGKLLDKRRRLMADWGDFLCPRLPLYRQAVPCPENSGGPQWHPRGTSGC